MTLSRKEERYVVYQLCCQIVAGIENASPLPRTNISNTKNTDTSSVYSVISDNSLTLYNVNEEMLIKGILLPTLPVSSIIHYSSIRIKVTTPNMTDVTFEDLNVISFKNLLFANAVASLNNSNLFSAFTKVPVNTDTISGLLLTNPLTTGQVKTFTIEIIFSIPSNPDEPETRK